MAPVDNVSREEEEAARALWEITNSPFGKSSCMTPLVKGQHHQELGAIGFPTPHGASPGLHNYKIFSPSQFSWSPLPPSGLSASPHPSSFEMTGGQNHEPLPPFFTSMSPALGSHAIVQQASGQAEGNAGSSFNSTSTRKKAYSKKLDFDGPPSEKASRVWLSLDSEGQRKGKVRASPYKCSPFKTESPYHHFRHPAASPPKLRGEDKYCPMYDQLQYQPEDVLDHRHQAGGPATSSSAVDVDQDDEDRWDEDFEQYVQQQGVFEGVGDDDDLLGDLDGEDMNSRSSFVGSKTSSHVPQTPVPSTNDVMTMNQNGGANWGGIQVRFKRSTPKTNTRVLSRTPHDASLDTLAGMLPLNEASRSPLTKAPAPVPSSPALEAAAMIKLSRSPGPPATITKPSRMSSSLASSFFRSRSSSDVHFSATPIRRTPSTLTKKCDTDTFSSGRPITGSCNCKKSRCLKLYCECFRSGKFCSSTCKCNSCANNGDYEAERLEAIKKVEKRKPELMNQVCLQEDLIPQKPCLCRNKRQCTCNAGSASAAAAAAADITSTPGAGIRRMSAVATIATIKSGKSVEIGSKTPKHRRSEAFDAYNTENKTKVVFTVNKFGGNLFPTPRASALGAAHGSTPTSSLKRKSAAATDLLNSSAKKAVVKRGATEEFLLPVFGPRSRISKKHTLEVLTYLDRDDMADACLVSSLWNRLSLETLEG